MARKRMLSPEFFRDAKILRLEPIERLLFLGLLGEADRVGVLKDRPEDLAISLMPRNPEVDVHRALDRMHGLGLVLRYIANGEPLVWIPKFLEHQKPHQHESPSRLPFPTLEQQRNGLKSLESLIGISKAQPGVAHGPTKKALPANRGSAKGPESLIGISMPGGDGDGSRYLGRAANAAPAHSAGRAKAVVEVSENQNPDISIQTTTTTVFMGVHEREFLAFWNTQRATRTKMRRPDVPSAAQAQRLSALLGEAYRRDPDEAELALSILVTRFLDEEGFNLRTLNSIVNPAVWGSRLDKAFSRIHLEKREATSSRRL